MNADVGCRGVDRSGWREPSATASAEIYDPAAGVWKPTGRMNAPRALHGAALLRDGRVLVAGGALCLGTADVCAHVITAELYDPATGRWAGTGSMATRRGACGHDLALVVLPSGKVLFPGGLEQDSLEPVSGAVSAVAEVYDPSTGTWEPTGPMVTPRVCSSALLLPSGKVLVVGGIGFWGLRMVPPRWHPSTATAELYDPETNSWEGTGSLARAVVWNTLTLLPTGDVLLTNGVPSFENNYPEDLTNEVELYHPATGTWREASRMLYPRGSPQAVRLPSGRVLVAGGDWTDYWAWRGDSYMAPVAEVYDPWLDTWTPTPVMRHYTLGFGAARLLPSGRAIYTGGFIDDLLEGSQLALAISAAQIFHEGNGEAGP